jgi:hypothetical protein
MAHSFYFVQRERSIQTSGIFQAVTFMYITLSEPIEKLYEEDNITFYKAQMPDQKVTLSHEHDDHKFVTSETMPENISGKFVRAIKKAL